MLADGSAVFAQAIGAELDLTDKGLGVRSRRWVGRWGCERQRQPQPQPQRQRQRQTWSDDGLPASCLPGCAALHCGVPCRAVCRARLIDITNAQLSPLPHCARAARCRRYAMLVDDGTVKLCNLEEGGAFTVSGADDILTALS